MVLTYKPNLYFCRDYSTLYYCTLPSLTAVHFHTNLNAQNIKQFCKLTIRQLHPHYTVTGLDLDSMSLSNSVFSFPNTTTPITFCVQPSTTPRLPLKRLCAVICICTIHHVETTKTCKRHNVIGERLGKPFNADRRRLCWQAFLPTFECSHLEQVLTHLPIYMVR